MFTQGPTLGGKGNSAFLKSQLFLCEQTSGYIESKNAAGNAYGRVIAGTVLCRDAVTKRLRPVPAGYSVTTEAATNDIYVSKLAARAFRVGDVIDIIDGTDDSSVLANARNVTAVDLATGKITFDGATVDDIDDTDWIRPDAAAYQTPVGILLWDANTFKGVDHDGITNIHSHAKAEYIRKGRVLKEKLVGINVDIEAALATLGFTLE